MASDSDEKNYYIPKKLLGELVRILITSTDPANRLEFTSATISATRALMIKMLENDIPVPEMINTTLQQVLMRVMEAWNNHQTLSPEEATEIEKMLMSVFKSESMMKYNVTLYRDIMYCEDLFTNWQVANRQYVTHSSAWSESNAILADIHRHLFEIIIRHNLMQLPYGDSFNLDQHGTDTSQIQSVLAKLAMAGGQEEGRY
jgi:hypothetical protein